MTEQVRARLAREAHKRGVAVPNAPRALILLSDLRIRDKDSNLIPLVPNAVQRQYLDVLCPTWESEPESLLKLTGVRDDILKARQQGISTIIEAIIFLLTINFPRVRSMIVADDGARATYLLEMITRFYDELPKEKKPGTKFRNRNELYFSEIDSAIVVGTAGDVTVGRGLTLNHVHETERALWSLKIRNPGYVEKALLDSVPMNGNVWQETTANARNDYWESRQLEWSGESGFRPFFWGWNESPEYSLPADHRLVKERDRVIVKTDEETLLATTYGLSDDQLRWRRWKMNETKDSAEKFPENFPIIEAEAFLSSGNPYFNLVKLMNRIHELKGVEPVEFRLSSEYHALSGVMASGNMTWWQYPVEGHYYVIPADTAQGLTATRDSDYCSADVLDAYTREQVGHLHGRFAPEFFARLLADLYFLLGENYTLIGVERENHGAAVNLALEHVYGVKAQRGNGASGLYYNDPATWTGRRRQTGRDAVMVGFPTTSLKTICDDKLAAAVIDDTITVNSVYTLEEMMRYIHLPGGGAGGENGSHDDRVRSMAIGAALLDVRFERHREVRERPLQEVRPRVNYSGSKGR
jgi:hypothetical protein